MLSLREIITEREVFAPLYDSNAFRQVKIGDGGGWIEWPGYTDVCADALWYQVHPEAKIDELGLAEGVTRGPKWRGRA